MNLPSCATFLSIARLESIHALRGLPDDRLFKGRGVGGENAEFSGHAEEAAHSLHALFVEDVVDVEGEIVGNDLLGDGKAVGPLDDEAVQIFVAVNAGLIQIVDHLFVDRAFGRCAPDGGDERQAGDRLPFLGEIVVDKRFAGALEAVGALFQGQQGRVANHDGCVCAVEHTVQVGGHGNEGNLRIAPLMEEDSGVGYGGAAGNVGGDGAERGQRLRSAPDEQQRAHTALRGDGAARKNAKRGIGGQGGNGNEADIGGAVCEALRALRRSHPVNAVAASEIPIQGRVLEIPHERCGIEKADGRDAQALFCLLTHNCLDYQAAVEDAVLGITSGMGQLSVPGFGLCQRLPGAIYRIFMSILRRFSLRSCIAVLAFSASCFAFATAQSDQKPGQRSGEKPAPASTAAPSSSEKGPAAEKSELPPLPPPAHVEQSMQLDGKTLHYTVTVGATPVRDKTGKVVGQVVTTAYTMPGNDRPVTFALNGGPGASSVFLNFGAIGPRHVQFGNPGDSASETPVLTDNPATWLNFTDLVFIDPVGTGFSRSEVPEAESKKLFYSTEPDIEYLSRVIYDWLVQNGRLDSEKYIVGESYGGFRVPRITYYLQSQLGVGMRGEVLISPYLNPTINRDGDLSPLPWMVTLPSITAAHLEREHKLTPEAMQSVIDYTEGPYATALIKGRSDPAATEAMIAKVTEMTGLDPTFVKQSGGRLDTEAYLREVFREEGKIGSVYDSNVTSFDPFPYAPHQKANDPILAAVIAPLTSAMVNFVTQTVGWKVGDARYNTLSYDVNKQWVGGAALRAGSVAQLRQAVAADPKLQVLIAHGWDDLSCPFMGSLLTVQQMPVMGDPTRVAVHEYPGGHMFYTRPDSRLTFRKDVMAMFAKR